jgi:DNA-binding MarR family transcriptional regulator
MKKTESSFIYRTGELERFLQVRSKFVRLLEKYDQDNSILSRSKILGSMFDTVFYIGLCNLRQYSPSIKEIYLDIGESRNMVLRQLKLLSELKVVESTADSSDSRVRRVSLTSDFRSDFRSFIDNWIVLREDQQQEKVL